ncbi:MAG: hypothetical protein LDLANPLL_00998 [Turneriella sp.]|nr:hypothetical protein [Turneriella sp.]
MKEAELKHFVESTLMYFAQTTGEKAELGLPYVKKENEEVLLEYTGIIGITGDRKGGIYITCDRVLLRELVQIVMGDLNIDDNAIKDMVGEIANTISGNATRAFGRNFNISVPMLLEGPAKGLNLPIYAPSFVIPATWRKHKFYIVVGVSDKI